MRASDAVVNWEGNTHTHTIRTEMWRPKYYWNKCWREAAYMDVVRGGTIDRVERQLYALYMLQQAAHSAIAMICDTTRLLLATSHRKARSYMQHIIFDRRHKCAWPDQQVRG